MIEHLGEGGFGITVKAEDNRTKKSVVVKSFLRYEVDNFTDGIPTEIHKVDLYEPHVYEPSQYCPDVGSL